MRGGVTPCIPTLNMSLTGFALSSAEDHTSTTTSPHPLFLLSTQSSKSVKWCTVHEDANFEWFLIQKDLSCCGIRLSWKLRGIHSKMWHVTTDYERLDAAASELCRLRGSVNSFSENRIHGRQVKWRDLSLAPAWRSLQRQDYTSKDKVRYCVWECKRCQRGIKRRDAYERCRVGDTERRVDYRDSNDASKTRTRRACKKRVKILRTNHSDVEML